MNKTKILVVEDDPNLGQILSEYLQVKGFEIRLCSDGQEGLEAFKSDSYQICLLDVMLPKKDGFSLAQDIRKLDKEIPFIFLTAKSMKEDAIRGLKLGADDYITKPFSMEELLLRLQAILRRVVVKNQSSAQVEQYRIGGFSFLVEQQILKVGKEEKKLTAKESALLNLLCANVNKTLERSFALKTIWHDDSYFNARSMDVYIAKLRKYLKPDDQVKILTIHGEGFKLVEVK
ncbi:MAG: response regulator transcription factor [Cytophagales bacterium]|nr:response regulator transcription factor [Cytophagales bacterium]